VVEPVETRDSVFDNVLQQDVIADVLRRVAGKMGQLPPRAMKGVLELRRQLLAGERSSINEVDIYDIGYLNGFIVAVELLEHVANNVEGGRDLELRLFFGLRAHPDRAAVAVDTVEGQHA
jgi:hypothetical protein